MSDLTDLQDAFGRYDTRDETSEDMDAIFAAAKKYANPDIEAMAKAYRNYGFLYDEWATLTDDDKEDTRQAMAAALGNTEDTPK